MKFLYRIEEILLIAVWKLDKDAFGAAILKQVEEDTGTTWMSGAVYGALTRLLKNGYIETAKGKDEPEGVGRPRIYYKITGEGIKKLTALQDMNKSLWDGIPDLKMIE